MSELTLVRLTKMIQDGGGGGILLQRCAFMPFMPFSGLIVTDGGFVAKIETIVWYSKEQIICGEVKPDTRMDERKFWEQESHLTFDEIVAEYIEAGWCRFDKEEEDG